MLSVVASSQQHPQPVVSEEPIQRLNLNELASPEDAVDEVVALITSFVAPGHSISLKCNLPTWSMGSDLDLHDLRELHSRSLRLIHNLVDRLRAVNIRASYNLTMSCCTSYTLLRVIGESMPDDIDAVCSHLNQRSAPVARDRVYLTTITDIPALLMT